MQHLLDFVHDHNLEEQLYLVVDGSAGALELLWERGQHQDAWQVRPHKSEVAYELVPRDALVEVLRARGVFMERLECELRAIAMTQIAFADMLLRDAERALGREFVYEALRGHDAFVGQLKSSIEELVVKPGKLKARAQMQVLDGGGVSSGARSGHLRSV